MPEAVWIVFGFNPSAIASGTVFEKQPIGYKYFTLNCK
jgi:hypothetical protein